MPLYEYSCLSCKKKFTIFCKISEIIEHPSCEYCQSNNTFRLVSRFKTIRSEDQILESLADPANLGNIDENDPVSVAKWARKLAKEMGEDMGDEIEALAEEELAKSSANNKDFISNSEASTNDNTSSSTSNESDQCDIYNSENYSSTNSKLDDL